MRRKDLAMAQEETLALIDANENWIWKASLGSTGFEKNMKQAGDL